MNSCARFQASATDSTLSASSRDLRLPRLERAIKAAAKPMTGSRYLVCDTEPSKMAAFAVLGAEAQRNNSPSSNAPINLRLRSFLKTASASAARRRTTAPAVKLAYRPSLPANVSRGALRNDE